MEKLDLEFYGKSASSESWLVRGTDQRLHVGRLRVFPDLDEIERLGGHTLSRPRYQHSGETEPGFILGKSDLPVGDWSDWSEAGCILGLGDKAFFLSAGHNWRNAETDRRHYPTHETFLSEMAKVLTEDFREHGIP